MGGDEDGAMREMVSEIATIRACLDQYVSGFQAGDEVQAGQAQVVQRIQSGLERLASLGVTAHAALPASIHEMLERGDRPTADAELRTAADQYETAGTGLDALEGVAGEEVERVLTEEDQVEQMRLRVGGALAAFREAHVRAFPTVAPPAKRARSEAEEGSMRPDVVLPADTETDVRAPAAGKVMKLLALQKDARAGGVVVQMLVGEQETAVKAPSDGKVTQHHVKQGGAVAAGERLLTLTTSNALVNYVSALCRSTVISCALERAVPPDLTSGTSSVPWCPTRFTLVLGVLGVLTARVAIVRSRDKNAEASAVQRLGPKSLQEASTAMKPMTSVGAELGGTTPRGQPGASEGADVVMGEGADEGATVAAGGAKASKSQGMASWRIEALSIGGVTEHLAPYQQSSTAVFRAINEEAYAALHLLRREAAASKEPPQVLSTLVAWLANYRSLFSARCHVCRRILVAEEAIPSGHATTFGTAGSERAGEAGSTAPGGPQCNMTYLPPVGRDLVSGAPYHPRCLPARPLPALSEPRS